MAALHAVSGLRRRVVVRAPGYHIPGTSRQGTLGGVVRVAGQAGAQHAVTREVWFGTNQDGGTAARWFR